MVRRAIVIVMSWKINKHIDDGITMFCLIEKRNLIASVGWLFVGNLLITGTRFILSPFFLEKILLKLFDNQNYF